MVTKDATIVEVNLSGLFYWQLVSGSTNGLR